MGKTSVFKRITRYFERNLVMYFPLVLIGVTIPLCFNKGTYDFGLNILAEMIGVAVTVFIVDKMYKKREQKKRFPIDKRIFADLQMLITSYLIIWKQLIYEYTPEKKINTIDDLIFAQNDILEKANLNDEFSNVNVHIPENLKVFFHQKTVLEAFQEYQRFLNAEIPKFIAEYKFYMDPDLYDLLSQILEDEYNKNITSLKNVEETRKLISIVETKDSTNVDPNSLINFINQHNTEHFKLIEELIAYSTKLYTEIKDLGVIKEPVFDLKKHFDSAENKINS